jgi:lysyl-tRNA synthetase class 2
MSWKPSAEIEVLKARAQFLRKVRTYFDSRGLYEVDTPLLSDGVATETDKVPFDVICVSETQSRYLQTSPEFGMKRLIAAGCGAIYYLGKAFRKGEIGSRHNPEFTMLEWYRPHWDHHQLMVEVDDFVSSLVGTQRASITTYRALFETHVGINPHTASVEALEQLALDRGLVSKNDGLVLNRDGWLDVIMSFAIEPQLGIERPIMVTEFPASQASLSKTRQVQDGEHAYGVAERFEYYLNGMELANGYHELICPKEQLARFEDDLKKRRELQLPQLPIDRLLIAALENDFPPCAGVALGIDRLFMYHQKVSHIAHVLPFAWERA